MFGRRQRRFFSDGKNFLILIVALAGIFTALPVAALADATHTGISFEGNRNFTSARLYRELERLKVQTKAPMTPMDADDAAFFIREFYADRGFSETSVEYRFDPAARTAVIFVEEGDRLYMGRMTFEGGLIFSDSRLRDIATASLRRSSRRIVGVLRYVPSALDQAAADIRQSYVARGYLGASVRWEPSVSTRERHMDASFFISEGPLFRIAGLKLEGSADAPLPDDFFGAHLGQPYTPDEDILLRDRLLRHFRDHGFFAAGVSVKRSMDVDTGDVILDFELETGPPYRIGNVVVTGVEKTNPAALRGLSGWRSGELYNASRQRRGLQRIWFTGAFSDVETTVTPRENGEPVLDLDLRVEEGKARQVRFSLGYNEWEMATGAIEFSDRNFFGSLTRLDVRVQGSQKGYGALAFLSDPFLLNTEIKGSVGGYFIRQEWPGYRASFAGGVLGIRRVFQEPNLTGYQAQFEYRAVFDTTIFGLSPGQEQELNYTVSALSWDQTLDRRNDPLIPMSGYFLNYELLLATEALGGDLNFFSPPSMSPGIFHFVKSRRNEPLFPSS
jgi:outer membrane protein assembly factor BamA